MTTSGSADFVPPAARNAVFDNDGTLWCERPTYPQALFVVDRVRALAAGDPELAAMPVVAAMLRGDLRGAFGMGIEALGEVVLRAHAGLTVEAFREEAVAWFAAARHPTLGVPFTRLVYQPMLELLDLLRAHGFHVFIVTGGGVDFVRAVSAELYGIGPADVVGSAVETGLERCNGVVHLVRLPALRGGDANEGAAKVREIHAHIGARPILAAGNSAGDREMLEYTTTGPGASLGIVVDHDDAAREFAYESRSATDPGAEPILESAGRFGWTVVSMAADWSSVFVG